MIKTRYALPLAVLTVAGLIGGTFVNRIAAGSPPQAQPTPRPKAPAPTKWEYCSLTRAVAPGRGGLYWISYFNDGGIRVVEVEEQATERSGPGKAIAKLGAEGWEMVGQGPLELRQGGLNALYFKRPIN